MPDSLETELKEHNILTIITRDSKIQVSHVLARQISPMLGRFIDNWNKIDNSIYLNYSSDEVNKVLDEFNEPGSLKEFLLTGEKKKIKFADIVDIVDSVDSVEKYTSDMKIKIISAYNSYIKDIDTDIRVCKKYSILVTINEKSNIYLFGLNEDIDAYTWGVLVTHPLYEMISNPRNIYQDGIRNKDPDTIRKFLMESFTKDPALLLHYYPLN